MTTQVLLLNASYLPLDTISYQRAVNLLITEKAIGVEGLAKQLRTVSRTFDVPAVIRMAYYVNAPRRKHTWSRLRVLRRDDYTCIYCGTDKLPKSDYTIDHIHPRSKGGKNTYGNTASACYKCNQRKGSRTLTEAGMKLLWEPKTPRAATLVASGTIPSNWKKYLQI